MKGPRRGPWALTDDEKTAVLDGDDRMARHHRLLSVRAHLLERAGDTEGAYDHYRRAAKATAGLAEQRYLQARAARLGGGTPGAGTGPASQGPS
ncbi:MULTISPECIES: hypothetical protein [unclassified Streptomyces]|uniref:hypothetical protein n=1 Tax=unclassified Streptomyces TaxID=2593676 RepID=UPI000DC58B68|nr:hypothetical protein [Streptomyces sp. PsTaAH-130]RAJ57198.1 hypothetical protein K376_04089 [Streptomyces sp. PsTaAH-130]